MLREAGKTRKEVAEIVGVSKNTVQRIDENKITQIANSGNLGNSPSFEPTTPEVSETQAKSMLSEETVLRRAAEIRKNKYAKYHF